MNIWLHPKMVSIRGRKTGCTVLDRLEVASGLDGTSNTEITYGVVVPIPVDGR